MIEGNVEPHDIFIVHGLSTIKHDLFHNKILNVAENIITISKFILIATIISTNIDSGFKCR